MRQLPFSPFFFFNDTATTEIYTLSLHDALPISHLGEHRGALKEVVPALQECPGRDRGPLDEPPAEGYPGGRDPGQRAEDRKSTRLNSSHVRISYAVFCLKKKKINILYALIAFES